MTRKKSPDKADVTLRAGRISDADALKVCITAAYADAAARLPDLPAVAEGLGDDLHDNIVRVAIFADQVVGVLVLVRKDDHLKLANIAVHPGWGGKGVGGTLLDEADRIAQDLHLAELRLVTHAGMPENIALYRHLGWDETGRSGSSVLMRKLV